MCIWMKNTLISFSTFGWLSQKWKNAIFSNYSPLVVRHSGKCQGYGADKELQETVCSGRSASSCKAAVPSRGARPVPAASAGVGVGHAMVGFRRALDAKQGVSLTHCRDIWYECFAPA